MILRTKRVEHASGDDVFQVFNGRQATRYFITRLFDSQLWEVTLSDGALLGSTRVSGTYLSTTLESARKRLKEQLQP